MAEITEAREFDLSKRLRSNYTFKSSTPSLGSYHVDIASHQSSSEPCLHLLLDSNSVASARRYEDESHTFVINTGPTEHSDADSVPEGPKSSPLAHLERWGQQRGDMETRLADNSIRKLAWKNRGVYGERFELQDATTGLDTVLATFQVGGLMDRGGKMRILVDWGVEFERIVLVSLLLLFEKQSFWGKTYDPRGGKVAVPVPRPDGAVNLGPTMV